MTAFGGAGAIAVTRFVRFALDVSAGAAFPAFFFTTGFAVPALPTGFRAATLVVVVFAFGAGFFAADFLAGVAFFLTTVFTALVLLTGFRAATLVAVVFAFGAGFFAADFLAGDFAEVSFTATVFFATTFFFAAFLTAVFLFAVFFFVAAILTSSNQVSHAGNARF
ncbi:MAG: hypothetical protein D8M55_06645 [Chloroflexi bacterium]|nr:hypothetical protein [Anaerolineae bacterium]MBL1172102.1 hypothetical protein [Chloroflexota bacterium]